MLVADPIAPAGIDILRPHAEVDVRLKLTPAALLDAIPAYDALIVRSETRVTEAVLAAGSRLAIVARAGVGVDNVDVAAATRRGVIVVNAPDGNTRAAAEHTLALMLALARQLPAAHASLRGGAWQRSRFTGIELHGRTLGLIGIGRIGREVARRAAALGMRVVAYDPYVPADHAERLRIAPLPLAELLAQADFVSLHVPLTDLTRGILGAAELGRLKPGACVVNCARGGLVDEAALAEAVASGRLGGAALDVFAEEPPRPDDPLLQLDRVVVTPHLAGSTVEAQVRVAVTVAEEIVALWSGQPLRWAVNAPVLPEGAAPELGAYAELAARLGRLFTQLAGRLPAEIHADYCGRLAQLPSTDAITAALTAGLLQPVSSEPVNWVNAPHLAVERGLSVRERREAAGAGSRTGLLRVGAADPAAPVLAGTVSDGQPRLVEVNGFDVDIAARPGHYLLTTHHDRPGLIGQVGTLLGECDINISLMHVGRDGPRGRATMILALDEPVPASVLAHLRALDGITVLQDVLL